MTAAERTGKGKRGKGPKGDIKHRKEKRKVTISGRN